jgi:hypothetical protein
MAWSGGTFTRTNGVYTGATVWAQDYGAGVDIDPTRMDTHDQDIATGINTCLTKDSTNTPSAHLTWWKSTYWGSTSGGTANAQTVTLSPAPTAYAAGMMIRFIAGNTNTGATTINANSLGAKNIRTYDNSIAMSGGEIVANGVYDVIYDGTQFLLLNQANKPVSWTPTLGGGAAQTYTSTSIAYSKFVRSGKLVYFTCAASGTVGGVVDPRLTFTLPVTAVDTNYTFAGSAVDGAGIIGALGVASSTTTVDVYRYDGANWSAGASRSFKVAGWYEAA